jgi:DNA-binding transcriptional MerR regulator
VSPGAAFRATAEAAAGLWEEWVAAAHARTYSEQTPSLLELQTICRETGCTLAELDSFSAVLDQPPAFLLCGADPALAAEVAALLGFTVQFPEVPDRAVLWWLQSGPGERTIFRHGSTEREVSAQTLATLFSQDLPVGEPLEVEQTVPVSACWRLVWVPHPRHFHAPNTSPRENEALLAQRAALLITEDAPAKLRTALEELNQKLWEVARGDLSTADERQKLFAELATVLEDRPEDLELRASAAWRWLAARLLEQIAQRRQIFQQALNTHESYVATTRHLLSQYQKNWSGSLRALMQKSFQARLTTPAFTAFFDAQKPSPRPETFIAALALPGMQNRVNEFITDQMAALLAGLSGLSAKLELRRISLGEVNTQWSLRTVAARLEALLKEKRIFPIESGKRHGLVGSLTGRKQQVLDERRAQISRAARTALLFVEQEFVEWSSALVNTVEGNILIQLAAALANKGLPDPDALRSAATGLDRLEKAIHTPRATVHSPESIAAGWLRRLAGGHWIPLYRSR